MEPGRPRSGTGRFSGCLEFLHRRLFQCLLVPKIVKSILDQIKKWRKIYTNDKWEKLKTVTLQIFHAFIWNIILTIKDAKNEYINKLEFKTFMIFLKFYKLILFSCTSHFNQFCWALDNIVCIVVHVYIRIFFIFIFNFRQGVRFSVTMYETKIYMLIHKNEIAKLMYLYT